MRLDVFEVGKADGTPATFQSVKVSDDKSGKTTLYDFSGGNELEFDFLQMHWHSPSEHTVNGKSFKSEIHFVH